MDLIEKRIKLELDDEFVSIKNEFERLIEKYELENADIVCWVPHEVGSMVQLGWEEGLIKDMKDFLSDTAPEGVWTEHDEPGTPFRENFYEHVRTKLVGTVNLTLIVKEGELFMGEYQDLYYYSPVWEEVPEQEIFCRIKSYEVKSNNKILLKR